MSSLNAPEPLMAVDALTRRFDQLTACDNISFDLFPGEVLGVVGESGSGKSTLLQCLSGRLQPQAGRIAYATHDRGLVDIFSLSEPERRWLARTDWGFVEQNPRQGLRMDVSAGGNIGERPMLAGERHYGRLRTLAQEWMTAVELDVERMDGMPKTFSGGMLQRLQIARNLVTRPRLVFMDEPTGGLDVSVQARLLDLLRGLVYDTGISVVLVTHDLAVARLLADRLLVMRRGEVVETGLTDRVLDDPQHPYTQLLVSSILQA